MDQIKIGKFIASCRKEQGMTQAFLAEKLGISDRAISKWETGKSMPDSGIMLELCDLLKINVNELLSGERIIAEAYDKRAEENLLAMRREVKEKNRQMLRTEYWIALPSVIAGLVMVFVASFVEMPVQRKTGQRSTCDTYPPGDAERCLLAGVFLLEAAR